MKKTRISTGTRWEPVVGYSRAVKAGNHIYVSGTTATDKDGEVVGINDPYAQTVQTIENVKKALNRGGAELSDVVRTRIFVTDIDSWESVGRAHGEYFGDIRPATSMVEISRMIDPRKIGGAT